MLSRSTVLPKKDLVSDSFVPFTAGFTESLEELPGRVNGSYGTLIRPEVSAHHFLPHVLSWLSIVTPSLVTFTSNVFISLPPCPPNPIHPRSLSCAHYARL